MLGVGVEFVERVVGRVSDGIDIVECKPAIPPLIVGVTLAPYFTVY